MRTCGAGVGSHCHGTRACRTVLLVRKRSPPSLGARLDVQVADAVHVEDRRRVAPAAVPELDLAEEHLCAALPGCITHCSVPWSQQASHKDASWPVAAREDAHHLRAHLGHVAQVVAGDDGVAARRQDEELRDHRRGRGRALTAPAPCPRTAAARRRASSAPRTRPAGRAQQSRPQTPGRPRERESRGQTARPCLHT